MGSDFLFCKSCTGNDNEKNKDGGYAWSKRSIVGTPQSKHRQIRRCFCLVINFWIAFYFLHSAGSLSDHGSRSFKKSLLVSDICSGISVSR